MGRKQGPRKGSMQFWPRKRAEKILPSVNWKPILEKNAGQKANLLGFIGYKAGMASAFVKDNTPNSMTKDKRIIIPITVIECPTIKILSIRFYKNKNVKQEILNDNLDKELKKVVKLPKKKINAKELLEKVNSADFDDARVLVYSQVKKTGIKKTPDVSEVAISGSIQDKINFVKENLGKEISIVDVFPKGVIDIHGLTKGKGFQGQVKRFGVRLRSHKAEKGQRKVGSVGAWHPTGIRFNVPMPGQMGFFTRITYNIPIVSSKKISAEDLMSKRKFDNYGIVKNDYLIVSGSVQGPQKRQIMLTPSFRSSKIQAKKQFELLEVR